MSKEPEEKLSMGRDDAEFVTRVAVVFAPDELAPARRAALDAELRARVEATSQFRGWPASGLAAAAAGALVLVTLLVLVLEPPGREPQRVAVAPRAGETATPTVAAWERDLLDPVWTGGPDGYDESEELPDDYVAIAGIFLDY